jgi:cation/acetate symporter
LIDPPLAEVNVTAMTVFAAVVALTLAVTYWASKKSGDRTSFLAAGRGISGLQNGLAISGDYLSASTFLGATGLVFLFGFDGIVVLVGAMFAFLFLLLLLAERMRNAGEFTVADVLAFRMSRRPVRTVAAVSTLCIAIAYLVAQLLGGGLLFQTLAGLDFTVSVLITTAIMMTYVYFGGMLATTWVQIIKATLLITAGVVLTLFTLGQTGFDPFELFSRAAEESGSGDDFLGPGGYLTRPVDVAAVCLSFALGTLGLPHILIRFFTVPDAHAARLSAGWCSLFIGAFFVMVTIIGYGATALLSPEGKEAAGTAGNLAAPVLAEDLGGGAGSVGGDLFLAIIAAVAFATILAVVAGLVISASGAVAHDIWANVVRRDATDRGEVVVARLAAVGIAGVAAVVTLLAGSGFNITFLVTLVFAIAASANFPTLLLALVWRRFTTIGAIAGIVVGLVSSIVLIALSPAVWPGPDSEGSPVELDNPAVITIPLGFIACWLGTVLGGRDRVAENEFEELFVRSETGIGAVGVPAAREREPVEPVVAGR